MMSQARWTTFTCASVGRSSAGTVSRPWTTVALPVLGSDSHEASPGMGMPPVTSPSALRWPSRISGTSLLVVRHHLDGGELGGLVGVDPAGQPVADAHLHRGGDRRHREADDEPEAVVPVPPSPQHRRRVDRGDQEAADEVGRDDHVRRHERHRVVEDHADRVDVDDLAGGVERDAFGRVHPGVGRHHRDAPEDSGESDRDPGPEVRPRPQAPPAEDVDRDEHRFGEEEQPLEGERHPERRAPLAHELRPQQPELEARARSRSPRPRRTSPPCTSTSAARAAARPRRRA